MNSALWIAQILLAGLYGLAGSMKSVTPHKVRENPHMGWAHGQSDTYIRAVGIPEVLGAVGLILPMLTGVLPWLTPLAALGLSLIQVLAIFTVHLPRKEYQTIPVNVVALALSAFVVFGRWGLFA